MTPKDIAERLDGIEYDGRYFYSEVDAVAKDAKKNSIVIVYGASDDLMEFEGAFRDELGAPCKVAVGRKGILPPWDNIDHDNIQAAREYFERERDAKWSIESLWCKEPGISWTFETDIPHETFNIMEDGEVFCRGIVFSLNDLQ